MQRDAHHERLRMAAPVRLFEHFVELVDDHVGEGARVEMAADHHRQVVEFLWIGDGP